MKGEEGFAGSVGFPSTSGLQMIEENIVLPGFTSFSFQVPSVVP